MEVKPLFRSLFFVRVSVVGEGDILIVDRLEHDKPDSEGHVVKGHHEVIDGLVARPSVLEVSNILRGSINYRLVQTPEDIVVETQSIGSTVPEKSSSQIFEAGEGVIGESSSLVTFFTHEAKSDMSLLNHVNIVSTISNGGSDFGASVFFHEINDIGFLTGRGPENNGRLTAEEEVSDFFMDKTVSWVNNDGNSDSRYFNLVRLVIYLFFVKLLNLFVKVCRFS